MYDNRTLVVENFNDTPVDIAVMMNKDQAKITDLLTGEVLKAVAPVIPDNPWFRRNMSADVSFKMMLKPHSYRAFKY